MTRHPIEKLATVSNGLPDRVAAETVETVLEEFKQTSRRAEATRE